MQAFQPRFILWGTVPASAQCSAARAGPSGASATARGEIVNFQRSQWSVKALNLNAFVAVAKEFGDRGQVEVAERELSRWHRDDR